METIDVFDELYNPLNPPTASIDEVHRKGLWHQTFACWIFHPQRRTVLLQQRGPRNRIDPGSFDASASGHLSVGETPQQGFREVEEELGLFVPDEKRHYLGKFLNIATRGDYINREFCHIFLAESLATPDTLTLQRGEVSGIYAAPIDEAIALFSGDIKKFTAQGRAWDVNAYTKAVQDISIPLMCNWQERCGTLRYYLKVMQAAQSLLNGAPLSAF
ncbi:MAG TPA: NUDIX domain-containing protein [Alphaproteobacteria bacterium]|nr:NUDIX domain-containing protein [Alphaproteobacteria bacterium]